MKLLSVFATFGVGGPQVRFAAVANRYGARYQHLIVPMDGVTAAKERLDPRLDVTFPEVEIRKGELQGKPPPVPRETARMATGRPGDA